MDEQLNMFGMLGMDETPEIPFEEQKKGRKGWVIEISGVFLVENGFKENMVGVTTHAVQFVQDSTKDKYGRISQYANRIKPHDGGWWGPNYPVYVSRPSLEECIEYGRKKYTVPEKVVYYERNSDLNGIWDYEKGNKKL